MGRPSASQRAAQRTADSIRAAFGAKHLHPQLSTSPIRVDKVEVWQTRIHPRLAIDSTLAGNWYVTGYWRFAQDVGGSDDAFLLESSVGLNVHPLPHTSVTVATTATPGSTGSAGSSGNAGNAVADPLRPSEVPCLVRYDYVAIDTLQFHINLHQSPPLNDTVHWRIPWTIEAGEDEIATAPIDWLLSTDLSTDLGRTWPIP